MAELHTLPRLFLSQPLVVGGNVSLDRDQSHYLVNVMRAKLGDQVRLFNETDGEFLSSLTALSKKEVLLVPSRQLRATAAEPDLWLFCSPIKRAHFDDMIMKATELGVAEIHLVLTARTQIRDVNLDRLAAIAREAAEQSERLHVPKIHASVPLEKALMGWQTERRLYVCAEFGAAEPIGQTVATGNETKAGFFTGPEGGFTSDEMMAFGHRVSNAAYLRLGPRILRADTAALAALACWQAVRGDWQNSIVPIRGNGVE